MPTLVVQLGHCFRRTGATGTAGEQDLAAKVGAAAAKHIHGRDGWQVRQILADSPQEAYVGDAFAAVHADGSTNPTAHGASAGYRTPEGQGLAHAWQLAYEARGWVGFRPDNYTPGLKYYYGTGNAVAAGNRRAFIMECGFLTNPSDHAVLTAPDGPDRVALALRDALGISPDPIPEEDMAGAYTVQIPESSSPVETVVALPVQARAGGASGLTRVWATIVNGNSELTLPFCHWRITNGDGSTHLVPYLPDGSVIPPLHHSMVNNEAPAGAIALVVDSVCINGGAVLVEYR